MALLKKTNKALAITALSLVVFNVNAAEISTNTATMQAMDKITGQVSLIDVPVGAEKTFESFSILVRECKTRTAEEVPENFAFVDVVDIALDGSKTNIFKGWMVSSSPSINAVEHPLYDVWLLKCVNKDYDKLALLTAEELKARDEIVMKRPEHKELPKETFEKLAPETQEVVAPIVVEDKKQEVIIEEPIIIQEGNDAPESLLNFNKPKTVAEPVVDTTPPTVIETAPVIQEEGYMRMNDYPEM